MPVRSTAIVCGSFLRGSVTFGEIEVQLASAAPAATAPDAAIKQGRNTARRAGMETGAASCSFACSAFAITLLNDHALIPIARPNQLIRHC